MMQHKFLLFSAVCCCLLEAVLCDLPRSAMFTPTFSRQSSTPSTTTSSPFSSSETDEIFKQLDKLSKDQKKAPASSTSSPIATQEESALAPPPENSPVVEKPPPAKENSAEEAEHEETTTEEAELEAADAEEAELDAADAEEADSEEADTEEGEESHDNETPNDSTSDKETSIGDGPTEKSPGKDAPAKKSTSSKKKSSKNSRKKANPNDPLNIKDLNELKERAKKLLRDLLKDNNANTAITILATNTEDLLKNRVTSNIIATHTKLIKETLTNEEAKEIIKDFRLDILKTFIDPKTPEKVKYALDKTKNCLSNETLPNLLRRRFKTLKKIMKNKNTYPAMVSVKNALLKFVKSPDIKTRIARGIKLLDVGIHFDPNNVMKSLIGFSFFK